MQLLRKLQKFYPEVLLETFVLRMLKQYLLRRQQLLLEKLQLLLELQKLSVFLFSCVKKLQEAPRWLLPPAW